MEPSSYWILGVIFASISFFFAILGATFMYLGAAQNNRHEKTKDWFKTKWNAISTSHWLILPETVIAWILDIKKNITSFFANFWLELPNNVIFYIIIIGNLSVIYFAFVDLGLIYFVIVAAFLVGSIFSLILGKMHRQSQQRLARIYGILLAPMIFASIPYATIRALIQILQVDIFFSLLITIVCLPLFSVFLALPYIRIIVLLRPRQDEQKIVHQGFVLSSSIAFSFAITFAAFNIGRIANPSLPVPQTFQMLAANAILDGATLLFTFSILSWALKRKSVFRIPIAITFDIFLAAVFAWMSLYFGLLGSSESLTVSKVLNVLIAKAPDGSQFQIGPYFWAMHTTFIPTLIYLFLIFAAWLGKTMLLPIAKFSETAARHDSPLKMTAYLCAIFVPIFALLAFLSNAGMQHAERQLKQQQLKPQHQEQTTAKP